MTTNTFECCDPWFTYIKEGKKVVEGRLDSNKYKKLTINSYITLYDAKDENDFIVVRIMDIVKYKSFRDMIETETLNKVLPDIDTIDDGVAVYRQFYSEKIEKDKGVIAIHIKVVKE